MSVCSFYGENLFSIFFCSYLIADRLQLICADVILKSRCRGCFFFNLIFFRKCDCHSIKLRKYGFKWSTTIFVSLIYQQLLPISKKKIAIFFFVNFIFDRITFACAISCFFYIFFKQFNTLYMQLSVGE